MKISQIRHRLGPYHKKFCRMDPRLTSKSCYLLKVCNDLSTVLFSVPFNEVNKLFCKKNIYTFDPLFR